MLKSNSASKIGLEMSFCKSLLESQIYVKNHEQVQAKTSLIFCSKKTFSTFFLEFFLWERFQGYFWVLSPNFILKICLETLLTKIHNHQNLHPDGLNLKISKIEILRWPYLRANKIFLQTDFKTKKNSQRSPDCVI